MVQRKVSSKLGFQADHLLLKSNLKPICFQHQDGKNRGSDMKKKMKRSKPIKISDFETLNSPPLKKIIPQTEKSPALASPATPVAPQKQKLLTLTSPATAPPPQKQLLIKSGDGSPNYMKATSCSEARKERLRRSSSRLSSDRSEKPAKTFPVRSLTKSPCFKPARSGAKKSSIDALCAEDVDVQKATCSSTLKDSKFPAYLMLNPGGTESEGTSVMKVCPYTYCSLNGHHHTPSPPLKCFLKAKRRSLKNQKSSKMNLSLSPRKIEPSCDENEGVTMDFFVEIYASREQLEKNVDNKYSSDGDDEVVGEQENKDQVSENVSDASSPQSEIDLEENFVTAFLSFLSEEVRNRRCNEESEIEEGENVSEDCDMEWQEGEKEPCVKVVKKFDDEAEVLVSDEAGEEGGSFTEEILGDDLLREFFCEERESCSSQFDESDCEMEDVVQNWEVLEAKREECDSECDSGDSLNSETSLEDSILESEVADMNPQHEDDATDLLQSGIGDSSEIFDETDKVETIDCRKSEENEHDQSSGLEELRSDTAEDPVEEEEQVPTQELDNEIDSANVVENQDSLNKDEGANKSKISTFGDSEEQNNFLILSCINSDESESRVENTEIEATTVSEAEQNPPMADEGNIVKSGSRYQRGSNSRDELPDAFNRKWTINSRKPITDSEEEERDFNPKDPNFLPIVPDPKAEKVDLKHQDMDDRKNSEEWMIDYALQQAVTKLAPARKRKVALLVEAFEKVLPIPKYDTRHIRNNTVSAAFSPRPIQACS